MTYPITVNGVTYQEEDFAFFNYASTWSGFFNDVTSHMQNLPNATSTSSIAVGTGSKSLTIQTGKWYAAGWPIRLFRTSSPTTVYMDCVVTSYDQTTGAMVVSSVASLGSGTYSDWSVAIGGARVAATLPLSLSEGGTGTTSASSARSNLAIGENHGDGTVSAPAMAFASDPNTGLYRIGADNLGVTTGGVLRVSVTSTGAFGIGTNSPLGKAHVYSGSSGSSSVSSSADELVVEGAGHTGVSIISPSGYSSNLFFGNEVDSGRGRIAYDHASSTMNFYANTTMSLKVTPAQLQGISSPVTSPTYSFQDDATLGLYRIASGSVLGVAVGGAEALRISGSGPQLQLGTATSPSLSFAADTNTGVYSPGADTLALTTGGTARMTVGSSGVITLTSGSGATQAQAKAGTDDTVLMTPFVTSKAIATIGRVNGQCVLVKNGANITLNPFYGNKLFVNGESVVVPSGGVSLAPTGLSAATLYYIYAYMSGGTTLTLEASTSVPVDDSTYGIKIKTADATRTLVGAVYCFTSATFDDSATKRGVRSYYNSPAVSLQAVLASNTTTTSTTFAELSSTMRCGFILWDNECMTFQAGGMANHSVANGGFSYAPSLDGATSLQVEEVSFAVGNPTAAANIGLPVSVMNRYGVAAGYHYVTLAAGVSTAGTATFLGNSGATSAANTTYATWLKGLVTPTN